MSNGFYEGAELDAYRDGYNDGRIDCVADLNENLTSELEFWKFEAQRISAKLAQIREMAR